MFRLRLITCLAVFLSFIALAVTGYVPVFVFDQAISGYWLIVHVSAGGVFAVSLAGLAVMEASRNRFSADKADVLRALRKACFWAVLVTSLVMFISVAMSMFNLFGTVNQERMVEVHKYSAMVIAIAGIIYAYLAFTKR